MRELFLQAPGTATMVAKSVYERNVVCIALGTVYALICDAHEGDAVSWLRKTKPRPLPKPFGLMTTLYHAGSLVDPTKVLPEHGSLLKDYPRLAAVFGSNAFLRFPIKEDVLRLLPVGMYLNGTIQIFSFEGEPAAYAVESAICEALRDKYPNKIFPDLILVTSHNKAGERSITQPDDARELCFEWGIDLLVHNDKTAGTGSYSICEFTSRGAVMQREGTGATSIRAALSI